MSYGKSNIILTKRNVIFTRIYVIHKLICDILDMNLCKIQLQFMAIYFASTFAVARHKCDSSGLNLLGHPRKTRHMAMFMLIYSESKQQKKPTTSVE